MTGVTDRAIAKVAAFLAVFLTIAHGSVYAGSTVSSPSDFSSSAVSLGFDGLPIGTEVTDHFQSNGVLFEAINGIGSPRIVNNNDDNGGQGIHGGQADLSIFTDGDLNDDAHLLIKFVDPETGQPSGTSAAGLTFVDIVDPIGKAFFYDTQGELIREFVHVAPGRSFWGFEVEPGENRIGSILVESLITPTLSESYSVDQLVFEPIPEPNALILAAIGLIGLACSRLLRRRRAVV